MKRLGCLSILFLILFSCKSDYSGEPVFGDSVNLDQLKIELSMDTSYVNFVNAEKKLVLLIIRGEIDLNGIYQRLKDFNMISNFNACNVDLDRFKGIAGVNEYMTLSCESKLSRQKLFEKYPVLKRLNREERVYVLYSGARPKISTDDIVKRLTNSHN